MLTHGEVNKRFVQLDSHPALLTEAFDGWLAWPIVKERLWLYCLSTDGANARGPAPWQALRRLCSGVNQLVAAFLAPKAAAQALLYERRVVPLPNGNFVHPHLGAVPASRPDLLHIVYGGAPRDRRRNILSDHGIGAVAACLAWMLRRAPGIRTTARTLEEAVAPAFPELPKDALRRVAADQLARFRIRSALFRMLFRRWQVRSIVVLDPDGKVPEVAAAKSLSLPVVEVQHGMFSAREPDYSWSAAHRRSTAALPLPDKVVVFGPLWQNELARAGYWRSDEIILSRSPVITAFRDARAGRQPRRSSDPLTVLFPTQGYVRAAALAFWREVLSKAAEPLFRLRIKVHPLEEANRRDYEALAEEFPRICQLVPKNVDGFEEMSRADVVAGYTSLMLLEAIGLGIPVIGLRGGAAVEGFSSVFGLPPQTTLVDEIEAPADFLRQLQRFREPGALERVSQDIDAMSHTIFAFDGPQIEVALQRI
jgi:hypothetical protein